MIMKLFQKYGHVPIILIGKGTTKIGDPLEKMRQENAYR